MHWPGLLQQGARQPSVGSRGIEEPLKKPFLKNWQFPETCKTSRISPRRTEGEAL